MVLCENLVLWIWMCQLGLIGVDESRCCRTCNRCVKANKIMSGAISRVIWAGIVPLWVRLQFGVIVQGVNVRNMYSFKGIDPVHRDHNMVIFVLDRTIWPFRVNRLNKSLAALNEIYPSDLGNLTLFPEAHACLDHLQREGLVLAAVCDCKIPHLAEKLLDAFDLTRYFAYQVCAEYDRTNHVETLHIQSGVDYEDMLYFDYDLKENLPLIELNITFIPVDDRGVTKEAVERALHLFSVRTTMRPPLATTLRPARPRQRASNESSSEYSLEINYKNLDFKKPSTAEIFKEEMSTEEDDEYGDHE